MHACRPTLSKLSQNLHHMKTRASGDRRRRISSKNAGTPSRVRGSTPRPGWITWPPSTASSSSKKSRSVTTSAPWTWTAGSAYSLAAAKSTSSSACRRCSAVTRNSSTDSSATSYGHSSADASLSFQRLRQLQPWEWLIWPTVSSSFIRNMRLTCSLYGLGRIIAFHIGPV